MKGVRVKRRKDFLVGGWYEVEVEVIEMEEVKELGSEGSSEFVSFFYI